jgi:hypothetical protein
MFSYLFCDKSVAVVTLNAKDHDTVRRDNPNTIKLVVFPSSTHFYGIMSILIVGRLVSIHNCSYTFRMRTSSTISKNYTETWQVLDNRVNDYVPTNGNNIESLIGTKQQLINQVIISWRKKTMYLSWNITFLKYDWLDVKQLRNITKCSVLKTNWDSVNSRNKQILISL